MHEEHGGVSEHVYHFELVIRSVFPVICSVFPGASLAVKEARPVGWHRLMQVALQRFERPLDAVHTACKLAHVGASCTATV